MSKYTEQAEKFLKDTGTTFKAEFLNHGKHFEDDKEMRDIYKITLERNGRKWDFNFGQSIARSGDAFGHRKKCSKSNCQTVNNLGVCKVHDTRREAPNAYDVLACIEKSDVGTFEEFCSNFGYNTDSKKAEKVYFAVQKESKECLKMFSDVIEQLQEIA